MLDNTPNQPSKFRTKNCVEINNVPRRTYNTSNQIKFKTSMIKLNLCDYSDAYILLSGTITAAKVAVGRGNNNIQVVFQSYAPFTDCIREINNT